MIALTGMSLRKKMEKMALIARNVDHGEASLQPQSCLMMRKIVEDDKQVVILTWRMRTNMSSKICIMQIVYIPPFTAAANKTDN
jgi:hypothetical protein